MNRELSNFAARLRESIISGFQDESFDAVALELFALQFKHNSAYRKICQARDRTPETVQHWTQIPAVPTTAFKELELTSIAPGERTTIFHSSGTTEQNPSRHFHNAESLALYEASLGEWFEKNVLNPESRIQSPELICLTPSPDDAPNSSLVHMLEAIRKEIGGASVLSSQFAFVGKVSADGSWTLDFDAVIPALNSKSKIQNSKLILGTAFSFVHLLDYLAENKLRFQLPNNSRVMETGGYKNRSRSLPKSELHALISERLGVPRENILCEYGMSELSSQAYSVTSDEWRVASETKTTHHSSLITHHFRFPPWARAQIISPETSREVGEDETGLIHVFDLANVFSVAAIQTEDLGIRRGDGFELIGRAQLAEPRGCSLMTA